MSKLSDFLTRFPDYAKWLETHDEEVAKRERNLIFSYLKNMAKNSPNDAYKKAFSQLLSDAKSGNLK